MAWQYAMLVTTDYVRAANRSVHIDELLVKTIVGRMYTRGGLKAMLRAKASTAGLVFDGWWVSDDDVGQAAPACDF